MVAASVVFWLKPFERGDLQALLDRSAWWIQKDYITHCHCIGIVYQRFPRVTHNKRGQLSPRPEDHIACEL